MTFKTRLRLFFTKITGYWIYKHKELAIGSDLFNDLTHKIGLPLNTIFDVGANSGQTAQKFNTYFPKAKIYCFEPVNETYNILKKTVSNNQHINTFRIALGNSNETAPITVYDDALVLSSLNKKIIDERKGRQENIEVKKGDTFCIENNIFSIDLLKIDTEGYELEVISGFSDMINNNNIKSIYCEIGFNKLNQRNTFFSEILEFLTHLGFNFYGLYEINNKYMANGQHYGNALFIHHSVTVKD